MVCIQILRGHRQLQLEGRALPVLVNRFDAKEPEDAQRASLQSLIQREDFDDGYPGGATDAAHNPAVLRVIPRQFRIDRARAAQTLR
jgi:hypothetical protein